MPIYSYRCYECGEETDELRDVNERDRAAHCKCGGRAGRLITPVGSIRSTPGTVSVANQAGEHVYAPEHRVPVPQEYSHLTPDQYEAVKERRFSESEAQARRQCRDGLMDKDHEEVGKIPMAEFLARVRQAGTEGATDIGYWKKKGRIYEHAKRRVKSED